MKTKEEIQALPDFRLSEEMFDNESDIHEAKKQLRELEAYKIRLTEEGVIRLRKHVVDTAPFPIGDKVVVHRGEPWSFPEKSIPSTYSGGASGYVSFIRDENPEKGVGFRLPCDTVQWGDYHYKFDTEQREWRLV